MRRIPALVGVAMMATLALAACGGSDDDSDADPTRSSGSTEVVDDNLTRALEVIPADATYVQFVNRGAAADRLGLGKLADQASEDDLATAAQKLQDEAPWALTEFDEWIVPMANAAFSAVDIEWQAQALVDQENGWRIYGTDEELDLDAVGDDLVDAGYDKSEVDGFERFTVDITKADLGTGLYGGRYPSFLVDVVLVPDEHLILVGGDVAAVARSASGEDESLDERSRFEAVVPDVEGVEYTTLRAGTDHCARMLTALRLSEDLIPKVAKDLGTDQLGTPSNTAVVIAAEGDEVTTSSRFTFPDAAQAEADAKARKEYLASGVVARTRAPIKDDVTSATIDVEDTVETVTYDAEPTMLHTFDNDGLGDVVAACDPTQG